MTESETRLKRGQKAELEAADAGVDGDAHGIPSLPTYQVERIILIHDRGRKSREQ
jgi:hypothetical protein